MFSCFYIYRYLKEFRTQQCPDFLQHKCTRHRPYTCFHWHFVNQKRRRPVKRRDGTFNYSADVYCAKYDETTGLCPDGDELVAFLSVFNGLHVDTYIVINKQALECICFTSFITKHITVCLETWIVDGRLHKHLGNCICVMKTKPNDTSLELVCFNLHVNFKIYFKPLHVLVMFLFIVQNEICGCLFLVFGHFCWWIKYTNMYEKCFGWKYLKASIHCGAMLIRDRLGSCCATMPSMCKMVF